MTAAEAPGWMAGLAEQVRRVGLPTAQLADAMRAHGEDPADDTLFRQRLGQLDAELDVQLAALDTPDPDPVAVALGGRSLDQFMDEFAEAETIPLDQLAGLTAEWQARDAERLARQGVVPVTVVHGHTESAADEQRLRDLHRLAVDAGWFDTLTGGGDWTCFWFNGTDAETDATRFVGLADSIAQNWWRVTRTAHP